MRLAQTSFTVSDLDRSVAFYRDVLGCTLERIAVTEGEVASVVLGFPQSRIRLALMRHSGHQVELIQYLSPVGNPKAPQRNDVGGTHMAFMVDDIMATYESFRAQGVRFVSPPQQRASSRACYFLDPDGLSLELIQWGKPDSSPTTTHRAVQ